MKGQDDSVPLLGSDGMGYVPFVRTTKEAAEAMVRQLNEVTPASLNNTEGSTRVDG